MFTYILTLRKGMKECNVPEGLFTYEKGIGFRYGLHFRTEPLGLGRLRLILMSRRDGAPVFQSVRLPPPLRDELEKFFLVESESC